MRKIQYFKEKLTIEEYIKKEICKNAGVQSLAYKKDLVNMCESMKITYEKQMGKDELFKLLIEHGCEYKELAEKFKVGVSSQAFQKEFQISHQDVKRLEKHGVLKKVGEYRFRAFGEYRYAPLYDIYQYAMMTEYEMQQLLKECPKGKRRGNKE